MHLKLKMILSDLALLSLVANRFGSVEFQYFLFFLVRLPVENNNKYSKFDISKSMSYHENLCLYVLEKIFIVKLDWKNIVNQ